MRINRLWNSQNSDVIANSNQVVGLVHVFKLAPNLVVLEYCVFCYLFKFYLPLDLSLIFLQLSDFVIFDLFLKSQILNEKMMIGFYVRTNFVKLVVDLYIRSFFKLFI